MRGADDRYLVAAVWKDPESHARYVAERLPRLGAQAQVERDLESLDAHLVHLEPAWHAVRSRSDVRPGDLVLIQGTGGVSLVALQFVRALGGRALVLSSSDAKLARVRELGASDGINYSRVPKWD